MKTLFASLLLLFHISSLQADHLELTLLFHYREDLNSLKSSSFKELYRALTLSHRAQDKGSGAFGHAWIWIHGQRGKERVDFELGHTGETDQEQMPYMESFILKAKTPLKGQRPIDLFFEDRWDGSLERGSGGHLPVAAFSIPINKQQYEKLVSWIEGETYNFNRYNLIYHQCCHFVVEALDLIGYKLKLDPKVSIPPLAKIDKTTYVFHEENNAIELPLLTPAYLLRCVKEQLPAQDSLSSYFKEHHPMSLWPIKRFWQRRAFAKNLFIYAMVQLEREWTAWKIQSF